MRTPSPGSYTKDTEIVKDNPAGIATRRTFQRATKVWPVWVLGTYDAEGKESQVFIVCNDNLVEGGK